MQTTAFANLSLRVEHHSETWRASVMDLPERMTFHEVTCASQSAAKAAAVDFALARLFGPHHGKDSAGIAQSLEWTRADIDRIPSSSRPVEPSTLAPESGDVPECSP
jgi:hypothetical protein